jgi:hypothetical protein
VPVFSLHRNVEVPEVGPQELNTAGSSARKCCERLVVTQVGSSSQRAQSGLSFSGVAAGGSGVPGSTKSRGVTTAVKASDSASSGASRLRLYDPGAAPTPIFTSPVVARWSGAVSELHAFAVPLTWLAVPISDAVE